MHLTQALVDNLHAAIVALDSSSRPADHHFNSRLVSLWLKSNKWLNLIKDRSLKKLHDMVAQLKEDELSGLVLTVHWLFLGLENMFELMPELILQCLNTLDPVKT